SGGSLGNLNDGWLISDAVSNVKLISCVANNNGGSGLNFSSGNFAGNTGIEVIGGAFRNNGVAGIKTTAANANFIKVVGHPRMDGNTAAPYQQGATNFTIPGVVTSPAVPASGTSMGNPFPFDCDIYLTAGTGGCTIAIDAIGGSPVTLVTIAAGIIM